MSAGTTSLVFLLALGPATVASPAAAQSFGPQLEITTTVSQLRTIHDADLDGDGDADVLSASSGKVAWYENLGGGAFGPQQVIATALSSTV